jgi:hypothetical protein
VPPNLYFTPSYFNAFLTILTTLEVVVTLFSLIVLVDEQALIDIDKTSTKSIIFFQPTYILNYLKFV